MGDLAERLTRCSDAVLQLYSDRYTNLGPNYDPDLSCPLSEQQIQQFHSDVDYIEEHYGDAGMHDLTHKLKLTTREFLDVNVVPEVLEHMDQPHFVKSFSLFTKVVEEVYFNLRETVLPDFPGRDDLSRTLFDSCIVKVYKDFEDLLLTIIFSALRDIRIQENIGGNPLIYFIKGIVKHFTLFEDSKWRDPYIERVREHTAQYANTLDIDAATFRSKANQRAEAEASLASSFNLGGAQIIRSVKEEVFTGFVLIYNSVEPIYEFILMLEETGNQEKFQNLLNLYGHSSSWPTITPMLKQCILDTGTEHVGELQPANLTWTMEQLDLAVWEMGNYERQIYSRLSPRQNLSIPQLTSMLLTTFKENFNSMFPNQQDGQKPEDLLAKLVEWIVSRKEGDLQNLPPNSTLEAWRTQSLRNVNTLARHLANKEEFIKNIESYLQLHTQEELRRRHATFFNFLNMGNVRNYVAPDITERLRDEVSSRRVSARDVAQRRGKVVDWICAVGATGSHEEVLSNLIVDNHCLYVVSVPFFAGSRKSVYIRMTGLQKDILNAFLEWKELSVRELYDIIIRSDITEGQDQAKDTVNIVLDTLITEELVKKTPATAAYNEADIISINGEKVIDRPYLWIAAPFNDNVTYRTNVRFSVDLMIYDFMVTENTASISDVTAFFEQHAPTHVQLLEERIKVLKMRGFIASPPDQPDMLSHVAP